MCCQIWNFFFKSTNHFLEIENLTKPILESDFNIRLAFYKHCPRALYLSNIQWHYLAVGILHAAIKLVKFHFIVFLFPIYMYLYIFSLLQ